MLASCSGRTRSILLNAVVLYEGLGLLGKHKLAQACANRKQAQQEMETKLLQMQETPLLQRWPGPTITWARNR